jgi:predicted Zn finger-like uncharacterized protein
MPEVIACPSCQRSLRVSDDLLGERVQCPSCGKEFTAATGAPSPIRGEINPRGEIVREEEPSPYGIRGEDDSGVAPRPRSRPREYDDEEDDRRSPRRSRRRERDDPEEDEDYPRRSRRGYARSQVSGPGTALQIVGALTVGLSVLSLLGNLMGYGMLASAPNQPPQNQADLIVNLVSGACGAIFGILWGGVIAGGATKMKQLENYNMAMTASILAVIPCSGCCVLTLPFGIWGLVVLNQPEVREAFR